MRETRTVTGGEKIFQYSRIYLYTLKLGRNLIRRPKALRELSRKAGLNDVPFYHIGAYFIGSIIFTILFYLYIVLSTSIKDAGIGFILFFFLIFFIFWELVIVIFSYILFRLYLDIRKYNRIQRIEKYLPIFLRDFSTNIKAGMEFIEALDASRNPDLGPLNNDIADIVKEIRCGKMIEYVLLDYAAKYDSFTINETFEIINDSYKGGGGMSEILDKIADNLENIQYLRKNAIANVMNYIVFITIISLIITPLLFALSFNLLALIDNLLGRLLLSGSSANMPDIISSLQINFEDFKIFSIIGVSIISSSAASIIGIIRKGNIKGALSLAPIFIIISVAMYFLDLFMLTSLFSVMFGISM